jgi:hypothetical protein
MLCRRVEDGRYPSSQGAIKPSILPISKRLGFCPAPKKTQYSWANPESRLNVNSRVRQFPESYPTYCLSNYEAQLTGK